MPLPEALIAGQEFVLAIKTADARDAGTDAQIWAQLQASRAERLGRVLRSAALTAMSLQLYLLASSGQRSTINTVSSARVPHGTLHFTVPLPMMHPCRASFL